MGYDLLIVGAGITAATLVAALKDRLRIAVIDVRGHLGGNCYDQASEGSYIHRYGPHIFHCPCPRIIEFLSRYTEWAPYTHRVVAEVEDGGRGGELRRVPFPYSRATIRALGRELSEEEVLGMFFRGYSKKMWGMAWEALPASVRGRVPKGAELPEEPRYYRHGFVALPRHGYTRMLENMLEGAELILGAPAQEWMRIRAERVIYTGRPDLIPIAGGAATLGEEHDCRLDFRALDIGFAEESWEGDAACVHACSGARSWTRKTHFGRMTGGGSRVVSTERPRQAREDELNPFYPIELEANRARYGRLAAVIRREWPNLELAGRLGSYRYFDMYQAVGQALALGEKLYPVERRLQVA